MASAPPGRPRVRLAADTRPGALPAPLVAAGLIVGVAAVSSSAVLVRLADAPALAVSFWRTAGGALVLAPLAWRWRRRPDGSPALDAGQRRLVVVSGLCLALHFALWIGSLSLTTVASSVTLVTMSPVFVGIGAAVLLDERPTGRTWAGMALTMAGAVVIAVADSTDIDLGGRALLGDAMALGGAIAVSGYLLVGRRLRVDGVPTTVYAAAVYGVATVVLLPAALVSGDQLGGYDAGTWWALAAIVAGPQLLGHTVFNGLLSTLTATIVAIVVLAEPVGATLLAWAALDELPPPLFWAGAPLILAGVLVAMVRPARRAAAPVADE